MYIKTSLLKIVFFNGSRVSLSLVKVLGVWTRGRRRRRVSVVLIASCVYGDGGGGEREKGKGKCGKRETADCGEGVRRSDGKSWNSGERG